MYNPNNNDVLITDVNQLKEKVYCGVGVITLYSERSQLYTRYAIRKPYTPRDGQGSPQGQGTNFTQDVRFVYESSQSYMGMISKGVFRITKKSNYTEDNIQVKGIRYILNCIATGQMDPSMKIWYAIPKPRNENYTPNNNNYGSTAYTPAPQGYSYSSQNQYQQAPSAPQQPQYQNNSQPSYNNFSAPQQPAQQPAQSNNYFDNSNNNSGNLPF